MQLLRLLLCCVAAALPAAVTAGLAAGCGTTSKPPDGGGDARLDAGGKLDGPYHPEASCLVTIDTPAQQPAVHVEEDSSIAFASNPPAGGPHYGRWVRWSAAFGQYQTPVPRGYWIHNLEHGGVVLLYKCTDPPPDGGFTPDGGSCAERAEAFLWKAANAIPADPGCVAPVRVRVVITPDPLLANPIAASAWGWTYTAECQDLPTLVDFAKSRYAKGPEDFCAEGSWP